MSANNKQVGGSHYRTETQTQHWDFVEINRLGYLEGCATKYLARSRTKHATLELQTEDLEKTIHYCEKIQSLYLSGYKKNHRRGPLVVPVEKFIADYKLNEKEAAAIKSIIFWEGVDDLECAIETTRELITELPGT